MKKSAFRIAAVFLLLASQANADSAKSADNSSQAEKIIRPGGEFCAEPREHSVPPDNPCRVGSLNFVFRDAVGRLYVGGPAHGIRGVGERVRAPNIGEFGTVVFEDDSVDFNYLSPPSSSGTDFALIKIDPEQYEHVSPNVKGWGGPTGVTTVGDVTIGDEVLMSSKNGIRKGPLDKYSEKTFLSAALQTREEDGDSGAAYVHEESGKALGFNGNCVCDGDSGYPTIDFVLKQLAEAGIRVAIVKSPYLPQGAM